MKRKFWNWIKNEDENALESRTLFLNGEISDETWYGDEQTPKMFKDELHAGTGDITVWINSPGGDVFAAAQIYNMLSEYTGNVTVKIDSLAASAASVIAMAGDTVLMSPVAMMMIHNPATMAYGDSAEMQKAIDMLDEVKESILNAYEAKTGIRRNKLSALMDQESWFNAKKAVQLGFADDILFNEKNTDSEEETQPNQKKEKELEAIMFSHKAVTNSFFNKITTPATQENTEVEEKKDEAQPKTGIPVEALEKRLQLLKP